MELDLKNAPAIRAETLPEARNELEVIGQYDIEIGRAHV